jgi:hypothetical protein
MAPSVNSHLIDRIRLAGEKSRAKTELKINGRPVPEPIKRRMLI